MRFRCQNRSTFGRSGPHLHQAERLMEVDGWWFFSEIWGEALGSTWFFSYGFSTGSKEKWEATLMNPTSPRGFWIFEGCWQKKQHVELFNKNIRDIFGHLEVGFSKKRGKGSDAWQPFWVQAAKFLQADPREPVGSPTVPKALTENRPFGFWVCKVFAANHFKSFTQIDWFFWNETLFSLYVTGIGYVSWNVPLRLSECHFWVTEIWCPMGSTQVAYPAGRLGGRLPEQWLQLAIKKLTDDLPRSRGGWFFQELHALVEHGSQRKGRMCSLQQAFFCPFQFFKARNRVCYDSCQ